LESLHGRRKIFWAIAVGHLDRYPVSSRRRRVRKRELQKYATNIGLTGVSRLTLYDLEVVIDDFVGTTCAGVELIFNGSLIQEDINAEHHRQIRRDRKKRDIESGLREKKGARNFEAADKMGVDWARKAWEQQQRERQKAGISTIAPIDPKPERYLPDTPLSKIWRSPTDLGEATLAERKLFGSLSWKD
jgi:hypothetical protein